MGVQWEQFQLHRARHRQGHSAVRKQNISQYTVVYSLLYILNLAIFPSTDPTPCYASVQHIFAQTMRMMHFSWDPFSLAFVCGQHI